MSRLRKTYNNRLKKMPDGGNPPSNRPTYKDSLALFNFTQLQKKLEQSSDQYQPSFREKITGDYPLLNTKGQNNQKILRQEALRLLKDNPNLRSGLFNVPKGITRSDIAGYDKAGGSYDIYHPGIKPKGAWFGIAPNNDYTNVKPKERQDPFLVRKNAPTKSNSAPSPTVKKVSNSTINNPKGVRPIYTLDKNDPRLKSYDDSLNLYKAYKFQKENTNYMPSVNETVTTLNKMRPELRMTPAKLIQEREKNAGKIGQTKPLRKNAFNYSDPNLGKGLDPLTPADAKVYNYLKSLKFNEPTRIGQYSSPDIVHKRIKPVGEYFDGIALSPVYKKPVQPIIYGKESSKQTSPNKGASPIYVSDQTDPRLRAYNDSLKLSNKFSAPSDYWRKKDVDPGYWNKFITKNTVKGNKPIGVNQHKVDSNNDHLPVYKKPVQPVIYKSPEAKPTQTTQPVSTPVVEKPSIAPAKPVSSVTPSVESAPSLRQKYKVKKFEDTQTRGGYERLLELESGETLHFPTVEDYNDWKNNNEVDWTTAQIRHNVPYGSNLGDPSDIANRIDKAKQYKRALPSQKFGGLTKMPNGGKFLPTAVAQKLETKPSKGLREAYKRRKRI